MSLIGLRGVDGAVLVGGVRVPTSPSVIAMSLSVRAVRVRRASCSSACGSTDPPLLVAERDLVWGEDLPDIDPYPTVAMGPLGVWDSIDGGREALGTREPQGPVNDGRVSRRDRPPWLPFPLSAGCSSDLLLAPPSPRLRACVSVRLFVLSTGVCRRCPVGVSCLVLCFACLCVLLLLLRPRMLRCGEEERDVDVEDDIEVTDSSCVP